MTMEQEIQKQVRAVDVKVDTVDNKVDKILMVLTGNSFDKDDKGLIGTVNDHEARLEKLEKRIESLLNKGAGWVIGISVASGVGIREIIALIFKH